MKKRKILSVLFTIAFLSSTTACYSLTNLFTSSKTSTNTGADKTSYKTPTYTSKHTKENMNLNNIGLGYGYHYMQSTGTQKMLVIPIETKDSSFASSSLTQLDKCFFGADSDTGWESVASFYKKSSYGLLNLEGEVSDVYKLSLTTSQLESKFNKASKSGENYTDDVLDEALDYLESSIDLSQYDSDNDGYIDSVWMIYSCKSDTSSSLYWAFTTWSANENKHNGKKASTYSWASIDFLTEYNYKEGLNDQSYADAHTYIHETGHQLGLDDYYSYDYSYSLSNKSGNADTPVGGVDMMDANIGDHMAFSKYQLGWIDPVVVTEEYLEANNYTLTLSSLQSSSSNNAFILPLYNDDEEIEYNYTPFDEYLIVEYYTPNNLNATDVKGYTSGIKTYSQYGVLVYHVNATIGKLVANGSSSAVWNGEVYDKITNATSDYSYGKSYLFAMLYNNTASYCWDTSLSDSNLSYYRGRLVSLLPASGTRINGNKTGYSSNSSLFKQGKSFSSSLYSSFQFDDGSKVKYGFTVKETSSTNCQLTFSEF